MFLTLNIWRLSLKRKLSKFQLRHAIKDFLPLIIKNVNKTSPPSNETDALFTLLHRSVSGLFPIKRFID